MYDTYYSIANSIANSLNNSTEYSPEKTYRTTMHAKSNSQHFGNTLYTTRGILRKTKDTIDNIKGKTQTELTKYDKLWKNH